MSSSDIFYQSADGLRLYARDHGPAGANRVPLLCLPGLTRNSRDFETLALDRRILAPDFRGRGRWQFAGDPATYRPDVELADTMALLDHLGIERVAVIGTSRGGIVAMLMAALHRPRLAGILLNDIGPVLQPQGLLRIRSYLGVEQAFTSWDQAVAALKAANLGFDGLSDAEWRKFAGRIFKTEKGLPNRNYDPLLRDNFASLEDIELGRVPELWELFAAMHGMPAALLRGEHSDLLHPATVAEMQRRNPDLAATTVRHRGHAPFLDEPESQAAIRRWLSLVDAQG